MSTDDCVRFIETVSEDIHFTSLGSDWSGLQAVISMQETIEPFDSPPLDVMFLEVGLSGYAKAVNDVEGVIGGAEAHYRPQSLFFIPQGREASITLDGSAKLLQLLINPKVFDDVTLALSDGAKEHIDLHAFNNQHDPCISQLAMMVGLELRNPGAGGAMLADTLAQSLAINLLRKASRGDDAFFGRSVRNSLSRAELGKAIDFMETYLEQGIGLSDVATAIGVPIYKFSKGFKAAVGEAPHQFLINRRIERARELLETTEESLAQIAFGCGFSSQQHFTSVFAKKVGVSPGRYRAIINS